jgi:hypothetical protein
VAARVRAEYGREAVGSLYEAIGTQVFDTRPDNSQETDEALGLTVEAAVRCGDPERAR